MVTRSEIELRSNGSIEGLLEEAKALANQLRKMGVPNELPLAIRKLLQILGRHGPQTVPQLARLALTSRQNIQVAVNRLKAAGYVSSAPNPAHKRSGIVFLTPNGSDLAQADAQKDFSHLDRDFSVQRLVDSTALLREVRFALQQQTAAARGQTGVGLSRPRRAAATRPSKLANSSTGTLLDKATEEEELPVSLL